MTTYTVGEFKARFSEALEKVRKGESVAITYGRSRRPVAVLTPPERPLKRRNLGILKGKVTADVADDWKLDDDRFLRS